VLRGGQFDVCCKAGDAACFSRATSIAAPPVMPVPLATMQPVSVSVLGGPVPACPAGQAHPNVCCSNTGPLQLAGTCVEYPQTPFLACSSLAIGSLIFPDPQTCCPLDGIGACSPAPKAPATQPGCYEGCGPGGAYVATPDASPGGQCCYGGGLSLTGPSTPFRCPADQCDAAPARLRNAAHARPTGAPT
jgi:hypothetical protein